MRDAPAMTRRLLLRAGAAAAFVPAVALAVACGESGPSTPRPAPQPPAPPPTAIVRGNVEMFDKGPIGGVVMVLADSASGGTLASTLTDADGDYRFGGLGPGRYVVTFVAEGVTEGYTVLPNPAYDSPFDLSDAASQEITITAQGGSFDYQPRRDLDFVLTPAFGIRGFIRNRDDEPAPGALVEVKARDVRADAEILLTRSIADEAGYYEIGPLPLAPGVLVWIEASAPGYYDAAPTVVEIPDPDPGFGPGAWFSADVELGAAGTDSHFDRVFWDWLVFNYNAGYCAGRPDSSFCDPPLGERRMEILAGAVPDFRIVTHDEAGERVIPAEFAEAIQREIPRAVAVATGRRYRGEVTVGLEQIRAEDAVHILAAPFPPEAPYCTRGQLHDPDGSYMVFNTARQAARPEIADCFDISVLRHNIGHLLGFWHVAHKESIMYWDLEVVPGGASRDFSALDRRHMRLAYRYDQLTPYREGPLLPFPDPREEARASREPIVFRCPPVRFPE